MWSCTASVLSVCRSQFRFHSFCIVFVGFLVLAGLSSPARSQAESRSGVPGFADESASNLPSSLEGSLSKSTDGGRFELLGSMGGKSGPIALKGGCAYVGIGRTLTVLDVSDPTAPRCVKRIQRPEAVSALTTADDFLILGDEAGRICFYSIIDPATPVWLNQDHVVALDEGVQYASFFVEGKTLFSYWGTYLVVVDFTDPSSPIVKGSCEVSGNPKYNLIHCQDICVQGGYAFLVDRETGALVVVDVRQGNSPTVVATKEFGTQKPLHSLQIQDKVLYALGYDGRFRFYCLDISDPTLPVVLGSIGLDSLYPGICDFIIQGNRIFLTSSAPRLIDVLDPTDPLQYMMEQMYPYFRRGRSAFDGKTLFIVESNYGYPEVVCLDWTRRGNPKEVGRYREPSFSSDDIAIQGNILFAGSSSGVDIVDVAQPAVLKVISRINSVSDPRLVCENLIVTAYDSKSYFYDISNQTSPILQSFISVPLIGNVVYEEPYLYGVSRTTGLTVVDLHNIRSPRILFSASSTDQDRWAEGIFRHGNFVFTHRNSAEGGFDIYDVTNPPQPVLVLFKPTDMNCYSFRGAGKTLLMTGYSEGIPVVEGYNLSDPINPRLSTRFQYESYPPKVELSSGLAYIASEGSAFQVFDITSPENPRELLTNGIGTGNGTISDIVASGSRLYVADDSGLSIYRHILPATPTEVTFTCAGLVHQDTRELRFKIFAGEPPEGGCHTPTIIGATPLVDCRLGCPYFTSDGMVACDETPFNLLPTVDCEQAVSTWLDKVVAAIGDQAGDMLRVTRTSPNSFELESIQPFSGALCGNELGLACNGQENRLLFECSIHNLMDGIDGNENAAETGGFGVVWRKHSEMKEPTVTPTMTPSPSATSSETPMPTPSLTETATETPFPFDTETPVPTPTATLNTDIIPDGVIDAKDLLEFIRKMDTDTELDKTQLLFDLSNAWKP